ncbi:syntaxin-binding 4-like [Pelobates cultripes]|uniref:Syntaxin-binding 4-like n=1 Tax=Pelobates cultripes TaxID=61616 RepID=A0AAD1SW36_PELCU|nr:syntaxin-binding 4-like [Pelobates cultripes]
MPSVSVFCKGAMLISRTLMGPYGMDRSVYCMEFTDCTNGLGIKVIGGNRDFSREEFGVYVKRILPGGVAYADGRLQPGDQILEVNGDSLLGVTNESAVDILRSASATSYMRLLIARDEEARKEFAELLEKYGSYSDASSSRSSPIMHSSRYLESTSSESSSRSQSPLLLSPASSASQFLGSSSLSPHSLSSDSGIQTISISKSTGLGLMINGGSNRPDGPMIYVEEILAEGDSYRDGRLRAGDQLVAINKDSMVGITNEEGKRILAKTRFRQNSCTDVSFIPTTGRVSSMSGACSPISPQHRILGNGLPSCRLKVHVRSPECRQENHVPSPSPDICPPELTVSAPVSPPNHQLSSGIKEKVSLDPHVRLKEEKLELILQFLGLDVSEKKRRELHQGLVTDCQGTVAYGDFLQVMRDNLQEEMEEAGLDHSSLNFTNYQAANLLDTSAFYSPVNKEMELLGFCENADEEHLRLEVSDLRQEVRQLKILLREAENSKRISEESVQRLNQKVMGLLSENRCLQNKLQVAELAQRQAHSAEHDYEEVVHLLETEIKELKNQMSEKKKLMALEMHEGLDLNRRLSLSDCQLRKSEVSRKHLESSNKKLFSFVQKIQTILTSSLQVTDEKRNSSLEKNQGGNPLNVTIPSAELLATEVNDILESCNASTFNYSDLQKYNKPSCQPGPSNLHMNWPFSSPSLLTTHNIHKDEELLCTAKEAQEKTS